MGNALADYSYLNLNKIVGNIHSKIYRGNRDRNRYQLTHGLYVWWEDGKIVRIFDCVAHKSFAIGARGPVVIDDVNGFGPLGFYVDVQHMLNDAIRQTVNKKTVQAYETLNDLVRIVRSDVSVLFNAI